MPEFIKVVDRDGQDHVINVKHIVELVEGRLDHLPRLCLAGGDQVSFKRPSYESVATKLLQI